VVQDFPSALAIQRSASQFCQGGRTLVRFAFQPRCRQESQHLRVDFRSRSRITYW
jgi:hypothetical protein